MAGTIYIRQSSFADGDAITAALFNNEFNQLANAFSYTTTGTTGHTHDGTDGQGGHISKIGDQDFKNKIVVDSVNNRWGVFVEVGGVTTEQVRLQDGAFVPVVDSDINLGSPTEYFKDSYIDTVTTTGAVTVGGALSAASFAIGGTSLTATITELNTLDGITSTVTELNYTDGVTSNIQTQLNAKQPLDAQLTDIASLTPTDGTFIVGDGTNFVAEAPATALASLGVTSTAAELNTLDGTTVTTTELNYVHNVTSPIQTQLNAKQALNAKLTDISNLTLADNFFLVSTGANLALESPATALGSLGVTATATELNYVDGVTSSIQTQLGTKAPLSSPTFTGTLTAPIINATSDLKIGGETIGATVTEINYLSGVTSSVQTQLDALQASDTDLSAIAALTPSDGTFIVGNGTSWVAESGDTVIASLGVTATATELNYTDGVTSSIQTQLDAKVETLGDLGVTATSTELNYVDGVTSSIQTQLDGKEPADATILKDADINSTVLGYVAPSTSGNVLTSNGSTWVSQAVPATLIGETDTASPYLTALGYNAGVNNTSIFNTTVGYKALENNTSGNSNTSVGYEALTLTTTGARNAAFGIQALRSNVSGDDNTAFGASALYSNTGSDNTAVGKGALYSNGSSQRNAAVGDLALYSNTSGGTNTGLGSRALYTNSIGSNNTAVGASALNANTATGNTAVGAEALESNTTGTSNVAVGYQALEVNTTGPNNTAVGYQALTENTTGNSNIAIGESALFSNTTRSENVAIGRSALRSNTDSSGNTAVGHQSMYTNTSGSSSVAVGHSTLKLNTTGYANTALGYQSLYSNTTGLNNTAVGAATLDSNTTGSNNTAVGSAALGVNTTGADNTAVGYKALTANTTGIRHTVLGSLALDANTTGTQNTAIGYQAVTSSTSGSYNVGMGYKALEKVTTGNYNTALGYQAASSGTNDLTTGSNNIVIGDNAAASSATVSNEITLGNSSVTRFRIPGIDVDLTSAPWQPLLKGANYTASSGEFVVATAGSITITLPASPSAGDYVIIKDGTGAAATTTFTVARNGSNIAASATDLIFDKNYAEITMTYVDASIGWSV